MNVTDFSALMDSKERVIVGNGFVFVNESAKVGEYTPRIYAFVGRSTPVTIPGLATVGGVMLDNRQLGTISMARDIYRPDEQAAFCVVYMPFQAGASIAIEHLVNGESWGSTNVTLNRNGQALYKVEFLAPGRNELKVRGAEKIFATFTVAQFQKPKFSAKLTGRILLDEETQSLSVAVALIASGKPYAEKTVRVRLTTGKTLLEEIKLTTSEEGQFEATLDTKGSTDYLILEVVGLGSDANLTAQIALTGTAKSERDLTMICPLGQRIRSVSTVARGNEPSVRDLYLIEGQVENTPILAMNSIHNCTAYFKAAVQLHVTEAVVYNPFTGDYAYHSFDELLNPGTEFSVPVSGPMAVVMLAAWVQDGDKLIPWEGWNILPGENALEVYLEHPATVTPGKHLEVNLYSNGPASAVLFVHPAQLTYTPFSTALAISLKQTAAALGNELKVGPQSKTLNELVMATMIKSGFERNSRGGFADRGGQRSSPGTLGSGGLIGRNRGGSRGGPPLTMGGSLGMDENWVYDQPTADEESEILGMGTVKSPGRFEDLGLLESLGDDSNVAVQTSLEMEVARTEGPLTVFAKQLELQAGSNVIQIPFPTDLGTYRLYVIATDQTLAWYSGTSQVEATMPVYIDMQEIRQLFPGDSALMKVDVRTRSGRAKVAIHKDGKPVAMRAGGKEINNTTEIRTPATIQALIEGPGAVVCTVIDPQTNETDRSIQLIQNPQEIVLTYSRTRLLMPGELFKVGGNISGPVRILPGLNAVEGPLMQAVGVYEFDCCEQTSAKIPALLMAVGQKVKGAEKLLEAAIRRMKSMFLPGNRLAFYPGQAEHYKYSTLAAMNLRLLARFLGISALAKYQQEINELVEFGVKACAVYGKAIDVSGAPATLVEAYNQMVSGRPARELMHFVNLRLRKNGDGYELKGLDSVETYGAGTVGVRVEAAYAAAIAAESGNHALAIDIAGWLYGLMQDGMGHSTVDSLPLLLMNERLRGNGLLGGDSTVFVNSTPYRVSETAGLEGIQTIQPINGPVLVSYKETVVRSWNDYQITIPVRYGLTDLKSNPIQQLPNATDALLVVELPNGYEAGLLATVYLPPTLVILEGGVQVVGKTLDFAGESRLEFRVRSIGKTVGRANLFGAMVTSMYSDKDAGTAGLIPVLVV